jgi:hypothetical protein
MHRIMVALEQESPNHEFRAVLSIFVAGMAFSLQCCGQDSEAQAVALLTRQVVTEVMEPSAAAAAAAERVPLRQVPLLRVLVDEAEMAS